MAEEKATKAAAKDAPAEPDPSLSRQAQFSSYSEAPVEEANPPNGPAVVQELGKPAKGPVSYD